MPVHIILCIAPYHDRILVWMPADVEAAVMLGLFTLPLAERIPGIRRERRCVMEKKELQQILAGLGLATLLAGASLTMSGCATG